MEGREVMARFNRASPAILKLLNKLLSDERPKDLDQNLYEFGSVQYHIQASASDPQIINLSVSTPSLSAEVLPSNSHPNITLREIEKVCSGIGEVIEPSREGFMLTLRLDLNKLPRRKKDRSKVMSNISSLQAVILTSQLKAMMWNLEAPEVSYGMYKPIKLVYHPKEPFFIIRMPEKISAIFPMRFKDDSDVALATSFFQELAEMGDSATYAKAPPCTWSPIPPPELRGESFQYLNTNGGFVSFDIFPRHVKGEKLETTVWILLNFYAYVKYHVKCTKSFIQRKMRQRLESLAEVIVKAKIGEDAPDEKVQSRQCVKKGWSFPKLKMLRRTCSSITKQMKRIHSPIKIRGLDRFRRRWLTFPKFASYTKIE